MNADQRHKYEYTIDPEAHTAPAKVVRMVGSDKRVLEIGAGPGSMTRLFQANNCRVTAVEIDASAIDKLLPFCERVHHCDLNAQDWAACLSGDGTYDVLVAADVFEHLYWPHRCLAALKPFFSPGGYLVVSLPHAGNNAVIACLLDGDVDYGDWGLLDRTHIRFFGFKNMHDLFEHAGYKIIAAEFVVTPPDETELAVHWRRLSPGMRDELAANVFGTVYQVVMKVVPSDAPGKGIRLADVPVPAYVPPRKASWYVRVRSHLGTRVRRFTRHLLQK
jgi:SAM-dependent methyltransferase